jgi:CheY-like chemotaxis protein
MHGGTVSAQSAGVGKGSLFTVHLPLSDGASQEQRFEPSDQDRPHRELRILVVDDNHNTASMAARLLEAHGHTVEVANDGLSAITAAHAFHPDAILLDIGLPGLNGYDVAKQLRREGMTSVVLIAISGYGQDEDRRRSQSAGFDHHLVKPVDNEQLLSLLHDVGRRQLPSS